MASIILPCLVRVSPQISNLRHFRRLCLTPETTEGPRKFWGCMWSHLKRKNWCRNVMAAGARKQRDSNALKFQHLIYSFNLLNSSRIHSNLRAMNICCPGSGCRNENEPFIAERAKIARLKNININSISFCNSITKKKRTHFAHELWCKVDFNIKLVFLFITKLNFKWIVPCYRSAFISFQFILYNFFFAIRIFVFSLRFLFLSASL